MAEFVQTAFPLMFFNTSSPKETMTRVWGLWKWLYIKHRLKCSGCLKWKPLLKLREHADSQINRIQYIQNILSLTVITEH